MNGLREVTYMDVYLPALAGGRASGVRISTRGLETQRVRPNVFSQISEHGGIEAKQASKGCACVLSGVHLTFNFLDLGTRTSYASFLSEHAFTCSHPASLGTEV